MDDPKDLKDLFLSENSTSNSKLGSGGLADDAATVILSIDKDSFSESNMPRVGDIVSGRYRILSLIGRGGMGCVYKVEQIFLKEPLALKVLSTDRTSDDSAIVRFQKEAMATRKLNHKNLVGVVDFGLLEDNKPFLVMTYVDGLPLSDLLKKEGPPPVSEVLDIFIQVCDGLAYAHESGIVHRDLKPSNIMIARQNDAAPVARVIDFGIAKSVQNDPNSQALTRTGEIFGSPYYMSPEQWLGGTVDHRSDIYSVGCSLFEALTGVLPFTGENSMVTMMRHQSEKAMTLKEATFGGEFPPELEAIVARLLEKDPADRYRSLESVMGALESVKAGKPLPQEKLPSSAKRRPVMSRTVSTSIFGAAALLVVAAVAWGVSLLGSNGKVPIAAFTERHEAETVVYAVLSAIPFSVESMAATHGPWVFLFPDQAIGTVALDRDNVSLLDADLVEAKEKVVLPKAGPLYFRANNLICGIPRLFRSFRPGEIRSLILDEVITVEVDTLSEISKLKGLQNLSISDSKLADPALPGLRNIQGLKRLSVSGTEISGAGFATLPFLHDLEELNANSIMGGSPVVAALRGSTSLKKLEMAGSKLVADDIVKLSECPNLVSLTVSADDNLSAEKLASLAKLRFLENLSIRPCAPNAEIVRCLSRFHLKTLNVPEGDWSHEQIMALRARLNGCRIGNSDEYSIVAPLKGN